jgi:hypothetical protein
MMAHCLQSTCPLTDISNAKVSTSRLNVPVLFTVDLTFALHQFCILLTSSFHPQNHPAPLSHSRPWVYLLLYQFSYTLLSTVMGRSRYADLMPMHVGSSVTSVLDITNADLARMSCVGLQTICFVVRILPHWIINKRHATVMRMLHRGISCLSHVFHHVIF